MAGRVSALGNAELRATILALKSVDRTIQADIRAQTRQIAGREWEQALARRARTEQQTRMLVTTARVKPSNQNVLVTSASSKRKVLSGGATPYRMGKAFEFGPKKYGKKTPGAPARNRRGYVFMPAAAEMIPRLLSLWSQTTFRVIARSLEGDT